MLQKIVSAFGFGSAGVQQDRFDSLDFIGLPSGSAENRKCPQDRFDSLDSSDFRPDVNKDPGREWDPGREREPRFRLLSIPYR